MLFQNSRPCFASLHAHSVPREGDLLRLWAHNLEANSGIRNSVSARARKALNDSLYLLPKRDCVWSSCQEPWKSTPPCGEGGCEQSTRTRCTLPRRPARVLMSFSISVYISSSEKRPMPWPYISRFTMPLVRWQKIHFSKSLKGPKSETIFCVSWRFSTHWQ